MKTTMKTKTKNDEYTKEELTVKKNGYKDLALAVLKQWAEDGRPEKDRSAVETWKKVATYDKD